MILDFPKYNFSFNRPVVGVGNFSWKKDVSSGCMVDLSVVKSKFDLWDNVMRDNVLLSNDEYKKSKALQLLKDKTILAYAQLRFDDSPIKMMYLQDAVLSDSHDRILFCGCNQHIGKEQPYSAEVLTPKGNVTMGSIKVNDLVIGSDGKQCNVKQIFEQGVKDVYRLTFDDGSWAECGLDHLWKVIIPTHKKKLSETCGKSNHFSILSLREIISNWGMKPEHHNKISIPLVKPINFSEKKLPIHPYIVGAILGDGTMSHNYGRQITCHPDDMEIITRISSHLPNNLKMKQSKYRNEHWYFNSDKKQIWSKIYLKAGLNHWKSHEKYVPYNYKFCSVIQRLEVLRGLLDTDGSAYENGTIEFTSKSPQLARDVQFLVESLGGKASLNINKSGYKTKEGKYVNCGLRHRVIIRLDDFNPFYLTRKANRMRKKIIRRERSLFKIEKVRQENSRCIIVDSFDHTYLTNRCIVTHNSFTLNVDAATSFMMDHGKNWIGILVSGSLPQSQFQMDRIKQLLKSSNVSYKEEDTFDKKTGKKDNTTQLSYTFYSEDGKTPLYRNLLICCPHTSSALGYPADILWLDEFDFWENCDQDHFLYQIAIPRTFRTKGKVKVYSNPDGKEKMMYKLWNQTLPDGSPAWHRYHFNYWDKPESNQQEFDKLIVGMEKHRVESTLLSIFTRTEGSFFSTDEIKEMLDEELVQKGDQAGFGRECAFFLDIGSVHDQSVLIGVYLEDNLNVPEIPLIKAFWIHKYPVGYPIARVVGIKEIDEDDGWNDYSLDNPSVKQVLSDYSESVGEKKLQPLFGYDVTGNAGMRGLFQAAEIEGVDITFTGKLKWHMYQRMQYYVQQRFLKRNLERDDNTIRGCNFDYQMSKLVVKKNTASVYKQIHHENENDLDDCCFVAGTKVLTDKGNKSIEHLKIGDLIMTREGYKPVEHIFVRKAKVITKFGLTGTPNHPFILKNNSIKRFKNISVSDILYIWNEKQSIIMEGSIIDTLNQNINIYKSISELIGVISLPLRYIEKFGKIIMDQFLKGFMFIIKMGILLIMNCQIWNLSKKANICLCMRQKKRIKKRQRLIYKNMLNQKQKNGISPQKAPHGIKNIINIPWGWLKQKNIFVKYATRSLCQKVLGQNFVINYVKVGEENLGFLILKNVKNAIFILKQEIKEQFFAVRNVLQLIIGEERIVYNLKIKDKHEYFANNILVHNCDALVGAIHLIENPDLPSLSFDLINHEGKSMIKEEEKKINLEDQYIPSFMKKDELNSWIDRREDTYN